MQSQIVKKKLRARKGKQRWRKNIDITELQKEINENRVFEKLGKAKAPQTLTYTINKIKDKSIYKAKDRFKKKPIDLKVLSKVERIRIEQIAQQANKKENNSKADMQGQLVDPWGDEKAIKAVNKDKLLERPAVIVQPKGGQSYHPSAQDHEELLDTVVVKELLKDVRKVNDPDRKTQKIVETEQRKLEHAKHRRQERDLGQQFINDQTEKQKSHSFTLIKKIKKELKDVDQSRQEKRLQLIKKKQEVQEAFKKGLIINPKKIGKKYQKVVEDDFVLEQPEKLRAVVPGKLLVYNQFESYYRRGLLEPKNASRQLHKPKLPKYKKTIKHNNEDEEASQDLEQKIKIIEWD